MGGGGELELTPHTTQTYVIFGDFAERHLSLVSNKSRLKEISISTNFKAFLFILAVLTNFSPTCLRQKILFIIQMLFIL